mmetsp:Transcript_22928/g.49600  ORF Transcript_22928/g.49600 Transcript_22928/m.49600 type:complete len:301 (+) Transcript_22928:252-1154(+)
MNKVLRHNGMVGVSKNSLHLLTFRRLLEGGEQFFLGASLLQLDGEIDHGNIGGGATDSHAGEDTIQFREDLADGLGGAGGGGNEVGNGGTSSSPVLATTGRSIHNKLSGGRRMDGGHETLFDAIGVIDNLRQGSEAVGRTRSVGHDIGRSFVILVVHAHNVHGSISGRSRDDNLLGTASKVCLGLLGRGEDSSGLAHVSGADGSPWNVRGVLLGEELDDSLALALSDDEGIGLFVGRDGSGVLAVDGIVLEEVAGVVEGEEGIVDCYRHDISVVFEGGANDETADTPEAIDSNFDSHVLI